MIGYSGYRDSVLLHSRHDIIGQQCAIFDSLYSHFHLFIGEACGGDLVGILRHHLIHIFGCDVNAAFGNGYLLAVCVNAVVIVIDQVAYGNKFIALFVKLFQYFGQRLGRVFQVVVKQQYRARFNIGNDFAYDLFGRRLLPVYAVSGG